MVFVLLVGGEIFVLASWVKGIFGGEICFSLLGGENFWWRDFGLVGWRPFIVGGKNFACWEKRFVNLLVVVGVDVV